MRKPKRSCLYIRLPDEDYLKVLEQAKQECIGHNTLAKLWVYDGMKKPRPLPKDIKNELKVLRRKIN